MQHLNILQLFFFYETLIRFSAPVQSFTFFEKVMKPLTQLENLNLTSFSADHISPFTDDVLLSLQ